MTEPRILTAAEIDEIERREQAASPGEWFWNSYSRVESAPMCLRNINEVELPHEEAGSPWAEDGNYPEPWKSLDKELNPTVCWVPPNHGDTATGRHKADAILIAHARQDIPALIATVRHERERAEEVDARLRDDIIKQVIHEVDIFYGDLPGIEAAGKLHADDVYVDCRALIERIRALAQRPKEAAQP